MEGNVVGTRGVLKYGKNSGHGSPDVSFVDGHCQMKRLMGA